MQIRINILIAATFVRMVATWAMAVVLWLSANEVQSRDLQVALLVLMSYFMTVSAYRFVKSFKISKEMEDFLKKLDDQN
jgi:hypothetical protein